MYIYALGSLIGILNRDKPVFVRDSIDLELFYKVEDIIDETPPITLIDLDGVKYEV